jgi:hypothetical protein
MSGGALTHAGQGGQAGNSSAGANPSLGGGGANSGGVAGQANGGRAASGGSVGLGGVGLGGILNSGGIGGAPVPSTERLMLWLDAQRGTTETSGKVSQWADQSGNGLDASQSLDTARPSRVTDADGLSWIEFDGIDDFLSLADGFADFSEGVSFFGVVEVHQDRPCVAILELSNGQEIDDIDVGRQSGSVHYEALGGYFHGPEGVFGLNRRLIVGVVHDTGSNAELRLNGEFLAVNSFPLPANVMRYDNFVGRTLYTGCSTFGGRVGEILLFARGIGDAERARIERYLSNKWQ